MPSHSGHSFNQSPFFSVPLSISTSKKLNRTAKAQSQRVRTTFQSKTKSERQTNATIKAETRTIRDAMPDIPFNIELNQSPPSFQLIFPDS